MPGPKQVNLIYGGKTPLLSLEALRGLGFKVVLYSTPALFVAARSVLEQMKVLRRAHDLNEIADASVTLELFQSLMESRFNSGG